MSDEFADGSDDSVGSGTDEEPAADPNGGGLRECDSDSWFLDGVLRALLNQRRRYTLYFLRNTEVSDLETVATQVAAMEQEAHPDEINAVHADDVQTSLIHGDLPLLENAGLIEYDRRSETVRYTQPPELLEKMLRLCATFDGAGEYSN